MNKKIYIIGCLFFFFCIEVKAHIITQSTAQYVAESFFMQVHSKSSEHVKMRPLGNKEQPTMYAFSIHNRWILVAGDRRMQPILAYSDENGGEFPDEEDMPDGMLYLLEWYNEQIESLRNDNISREDNPCWELYLEDNNRVASNRSVVIEPLLTRNGYGNIWKQSGNNSGNAPETSYNKFCPSVNTPEYSCDHAVTGCVATAMSQVMWYWQWPYAAIVKDDADNRLVRMYDWKIMPYKLTNSSSIEEADMVANLLHDVGVAVSMTYGCSGHGGSRASPSYLSPALRNIFGYNADNLIHRSSYSDNEWLSMMIGELNNYRPLLYGGQSPSGGHRFVIDGFDTENLFHVNFGWGGSSNGYYTISNMIYNNSQSMVINIYPNYPSCFPLQITSTDELDSMFIIHNGGAISIGNRNITTGMHGCILSGESVTLTSGFEIQAGADVYIDIKDMHCNDRSYLREQQENQRCNSMPQKVSNVDNVPIVSKLFRDGQILILRGDETYTITGQRIE